MLIKETNNIDEINNFFMNNYLSKMEIFVNLVRKVSVREEMKRVQGSTFETITRRLIEDRDTILELAANIQELQNEINCMNDSRDFQDAESVRNGQSQVTRQPVFFPPFRDRGGMLSRSVGMQSRNDRPPSILGHAWKIGKLFFFCKSNGVFFNTLSRMDQSVDFHCVRTYITACIE